MAAEQLTIAGAEPDEDAPVKAPRTKSAPTCAFGRIGDRVVECDYQGQPRRFCVIAGIASLVRVNETGKRDGGGDKYDPETGKGHRSADRIRRPVDGDEERIALRESIRTMDGIITSGPRDVRWANDGVVSAEAGLKRAQDKLNEARGALAAVESKVAAAETGIGPARERLAALGTGTK